MAFNISQFRHSFKNGEPASPANYEIEIHKNPQSLLDNNANNNTLQRVVHVNDKFERNVKFRCQNATLPGKQITTSERSTYGPVRKIASNIIYQDVVLSFIVADDFNEKIYFNIWLEQILDSLNSNSVAYYDDYVGQIFVTTYGKDGLANYKVLLEEAYPIAVDEIPLSWDSSNDYIRMNVTIAYRKWTSIEISTAKQQTVPRDVLNPDLKKNFTKRISDALSTTKDKIDTEITKIIKL